MITQTIFWILIIYGTTQIIVESVLFKPLRNLFKSWIWTEPINILLTCMLCTSTWLSFLYSYYWWSPLQYIFNQSFILNNHNCSWFIDGMFGSCVVWFISLFEKLLTKYITK